LALKFIKGENRHQLCLFPVSIDQSVVEKNEVRFIDLFVDSLDLSTFGFKSDFVGNGRKIERHIVCIDSRLEGYSGILAYFKSSGNSVVPDHQIKIHPPLAA